MDVRSACASIAASTQQPPPTLAPTPPLPHCASSLLHQPRSVLFNYLKYQKLKSELAPGGITPTVSAAKLSSEGEAEPGSSGGGSEVEMMGGGGGGYGALGPFDTAASGPLVGSPRRASGTHHLSARRSGSGDHQVLILGLREGSLVDDELLLRHSPRRPVLMRSRGPSPTAAYAAQREL